MYFLMFDRICQNILQSSCTLYIPKQHYRSASYSYIFLVNLMEENCPFVLIYTYFMNSDTESLFLSICSY